MSSMKWFKKKDQFILKIINKKILQTIIEPNKNMRIINEINLWIYQLQ